MEGGDWGDACDRVEVKARWHVGGNGWRGFHSGYHINDGEGEAKASEASAATGRGGVGDSS